MKAFQTRVLTDSVTLPGAYLNSRVMESISNSLRNDLEGVCSKHGLIRRGSIRVLEASDGHVCVESGAPTRFSVLFEADVCNPSVGSVVECVVEAKNASAAYAVHRCVPPSSGIFDESARVIEVVLARAPKSFTHDVEFDDAVRVGDSVNVRIVGKSFRLGQPTITCAGQVLASDVEEHVELDSVAEAPAIETPLLVSDAHDSASTLGEDRASDAECDEDDQETDDEGSV
jgi:DNA-directed RNA polymerase subunit E'/Rpb7